MMGGSEPRESLVHRKWPEGLLKAVTFSSEYSGDWKFAEMSSKTTLKLTHFRVKNVCFSPCSARGDTLHGFGVFWDVFHSIQGTWGSQIGPKSVRFQKIASGTLIFLLVLMVLLACKCNFEALI